MSGHNHGEEAIFESALNLQSPAEREAFLRAACGADDAMRERLSGLLQAHDRAGQFLEPGGQAHDRALAAAVRDAADAGGLAVAPGGPPAERGGDRIGRYTLLEKLGEGGFGDVWMAEQQEPVRRQVALKIIKLGMDTREVVGRFEAERQALALMDHPNIAQVFDGGITDTGRPYFVMELVPGIPITAFCEAHRLPTRARLELVMQVCQAVQHAHQKGMIHRDLKPSNILVTIADGRPVPKVIDFGVAKAVEGRLTGETVVTLLHQLIGTPSYMSPEQAGLGDRDIDTRSDIYALGVLLYELLTGRTPFDSQELLQAGVDDMRRIIREKDPPRPSTCLTQLVAANARRLTAKSEIRDPKSEIDRASARRLLQEKRELLRLVRGDLDWIVMKCLEKDRTRRYATANGLAADLQRHLNHEPVVARPPSQLYRFRKMVRRNRLASILVGAVAAAVAIGLGVSLWLLGREKAAHRQAHAAEHKASAGLREAYLAQAQAMRFSGRPGRRFNSLEALRKAAAIQPGLDLRNEAIACLALPDLRVAKEWRLPFDTSLKAFDPDLKSYACADLNGTITIHRADDQRETLRLPSPGAGTWLPEFSPDGRFLAVEYFTRPRTVRVWNLDSGRAVLEVPHGRGFAFRPDSQEIAISTETNSVAIHSLPNGQWVRSLSESGRPHLRYSPDGRSLAAGSEARSDVRIYDLTALDVTRTLPVPRGVFALAWHPEGRQLAAAGDGNRIHLFEVATGKGLAKLQGHQSAVVRLAYNHAGSLLASSAWDGDICLWDPERAALVLTYPHAHICHFSPDDRFLGIDQGRSNLKLLEVAEGHECRLLQMRTEAGQSAWGVSFHPAGRLLASAELDGVGLWDAFTGKSAASLDISNTTSALFHPLTGDLLTINPHGLERRPVTFAPTPDAPRLRLHPPRQLLRSANLKLATISRDGTLLAATHADDGAALVDLTVPDQPRCLRVSHPDAQFVAVRPDGQWVATGTWHGTGVRVWERPTGRQVTELPLAVFSNGIVSASVTFSPDGQWLVTGTATEYAFWTVGRWERHHSIPQAEGNRPPGAITFSGDARWAAISHGRRALHLIESPSGKPIATLEAPDGRNVWTMALSVDGRFLAVATEGHLIQLWDLARIRQQLAALKLDWEAPPYPRLEEVASVPPLHVEVVAE